jgi:lipopolysaccharide/colanic/teichoic acid biosynthesis glycosyltransferase
METLDRAATEYLQDPVRAAPSDLRPAVHNTNQNGLRLCFGSDGPLAPPESGGRDAALVLKRVFDLVSASVALLALSPLLLGIALAIVATSHGPVTFVQLRTGLAGQPFRILKFRTMFAGRGDATGVTQTTPEDGRVTPVGRLLRRTGLDELPQLINVIGGQMSIVGPRPHPVRILAAGIAYDQLVPYYAMRHEMRPGITGWAQAHGLRGPTENEQRARARIDHDIAYIQNFSLWLDLKIVWLTLRREVLRGGV